MEIVEAMQALDYVLKRHGLEVSASLVATHKGKSQLTMLNPNNRWIGYRHEFGTFRGTHMTILGRDVQIVEKLK